MVTMIITNYHDNQAQDIKKQIDALLRREYIERDENNPEIYNYKA